MNTFLEKLKNNGIDSNTDLELVKRIRLCNDMSIAGISVGFIVLSYALLSKWNINIILVISFLLTTTFIPPVLNFYRKTIAARNFYLIISIIVVLYLCITIGPAFNFQYFLFGIIGLPLMFFGLDISKKSLFWPIIVIVFFIYLEWHFTVFEPLMKVDLSNQKPICFTNNLITILSVFNQFYWLVKENKNHIEEIEIKSTEINEKNVQLEYFAYIASHDLKEPLRTVNSFVDIIQEEYEDPSDESLNNYFSFIRDALDRMRLMINGLLSYSKIGKSGNYKTVNINSLITEIETDLSELINRLNVTILTLNLPVIYCLAIEVRQLFQNLITNAVKFQQPGVAPVIEITHMEKPGYWQFCVADNGIGISSKRYEEIFQMFRKLHLPEKYKGHGIGLAFCKKIVEIHNGKIWVESTVGGGSCFYFTIKKKLYILKRNYATYF